MPAAELDIIGSLVGGSGPAAGLALGGYYISRAMRAISEKFIEDGSRERETQAQMWKQERESFMERFERMDAAHDRDTAALGATCHATADRQADAVNRNSDAVERVAQAVERQADSCGEVNAQIASLTTKIDTLLSVRAHPQ